MPAMRHTRGRGEVAPLGTDDLDALAFAAWRLGHAKESSRAAERVFAQLARTDPIAAAMKANELALAMAGAW